MKKRVQKRPAVKRKPKTKLIPVGLTPPVQQVRFSQFQVVPDPGKAPWVFALGVDGLLYTYDWLETVWLQCPLEFRTDLDVLTAQGKSDELGGC